LNVNDRLGAREASLQASILLAELVKFVSEQFTGSGFWTSALRACKLALVTKLAPLGDVRGVDALSPEKSATLGGATGGRLIGLKDAQFLGSAAGAAVTGLDHEPVKSGNSDDSE